MVTKDDAGKVHVSKDEMATRHGAWGGAAVGALVGILFPPAILATAAVGGLGGHLWRGMSRADVKELGEVIDDGQAALVIVGESTVEQALDKAALKAGKHVAKELDVSPKDVDQGRPGSRQRNQLRPAGPGRAWRRPAGPKRRHPGGCMRAVGGRNGSFR